MEDDSGVDLNLNLNDEGSQVLNLRDQPFEVREDTEFKTKPLDQHI